MKTIIYYLLILSILSSCGRNIQEEETIKPRYIELLIDKEKHEKKLLKKRIDHLNSCLMLNSHTFSDSLITSQNVSEKFNPILNLVEQFIKSNNEELIESIRGEFRLLQEYLVTYDQVSTEQVRIIDDYSYNQTLSFLSKSADSLLCHYVSADLYNEVLLQKLEILEFKYDSLLYEVKDSLEAYSMNPYRKSLIITEEGPNETKVSASQ